MNGMAPTQESHRLGPAPALLVFEGSMEKAAARGTILLYHGFSASKESNVKELESLAARGFLAVGVDNIGHGKRRYPDFEYRFFQAHEGFGTAFIEAVQATAEEVPTVVGALAGRGLVKPGRLGLTGISMGGYIAFQAALLDRRIVAAAPVLASPCFQAPATDSPHEHPERFFPLALLTQNAGKDEHVPPEHSREFHKVLKPLYASAPERLKHVEFAEAGHFMPEADWEQLWENLLTWFEKFLDGKAR